MNEYFPDQWELVKISGTDPHYRVFGSWSGGYLNGDSWRLNSGITKCVESEEYPGRYEFIGHSGSKYICHKASYGISSVHNIGVLNHYCENSDGKMEVLKDMPEDLINFDWMISND